MQNDTVAKIVANPHYQELVAKRTPFGIWLTIAMLVAYYGFIALIAFNKEFLAQPLGDSVITMGLPVGIGLILFTVGIIGIYVRRASTEFDVLTQKIVDEVTK